MKEIWRDIEGYEGIYQVSNLGKVKSLSRKMWNGYKWWTSKERILVPRIDKNKKHYYAVQLVKDKKKKSKNIHRLVAETFLPNPNNLRCVNHKDENKLNNTVNNLEWCSQSYNLTYGNMDDVNKKKRKCISFNHVKTGTSFTLDYPEDYERLGFSRKAVRTALGRNKPYKGYIVKYIER